MANSSNNIDDVTKEMAHMKIKKDKFFIVKISTVTNLYIGTKKELEKTVRFINQYHHNFVGNDKKEWVEVDWKAYIKLIAKSIYENIQNSKELEPDDKISSMIIQYKIDLYDHKNELICDIKETGFSITLKRSVKYFYKVYAKDGPEEQIYTDLLISLIQPHITIKQLFNYLITKKKNTPTSHGFDV